MIPDCQECGNNLGVGKGCYACAVYDFAILSRDAEVAQLRAKLATEREAREAAERELEAAAMAHGETMREYKERLDVIHAAQNRAMAELEAAALALAAQKRAEARVERYEKALRDIAQWTSVRPGERDVWNRASKALEASQAPAALEAAKEPKR